MKNLFNDISQDERTRILEMHVKATKRNYLNEQEDPNYNASDVSSKVTKIKTSQDDLNRFLMLDQNYVQSLFPNLVFKSKSDWDTIKYPLQQALTWYAKSGRNPSTNVLSSVVTNIGGDFPQRYQMMTKGSSTESGKGFVSDPKTLDNQFKVLYNTQLTKV
jgi:hypothetical protein